MAHTGNVAQPIDTVGDVLEIRVYCSFQDQTSVNVRHFVVSAAAGGGATFDTILTYYDGFVPAVMKPLMHNAAAYKGIVIRRVSPLPPSGPAYSDEAAGAGTAGDAPLPSQVAGIVTFRSALGGRKFRGRMYAPFPSAADLDADDTPTVLYVGKLNDLGDVFTGTDEIGAAGNTIQLKSIIYHRADRSATAFAQWVSRKKWATQRRRGNYGKPNSSPV